MTKVLDPHDPLGSPRVAGVKLLPAMAMVECEPTVTDFVTLARRGTGASM